MVDKKDPNVLSAKTLIGTDVINKNGDKIGNIKEIMIDLDYGRVAYAVLQFGGIMGVGDKYFAIPWTAMEVDTTHDDMILDINKETLKESEGFAKDDWPEFANYKWMRETYDQYGYQPYWT